MQEIVTNATHISAKYSAGPNSSASRTTCGASTASRTVPIRPAMNEPIADVTRAAAPRPRRAIWLPSMVVTSDPVSPGVLIRIDVVDDPYIAP